MAGKTLDIAKFIAPDQIGVNIANQWQEWDILMTPRRQAWEEIQRYIYSTDTTTTSNSKLPWKNKTTLPKLCQIRDNLFSNYVASLFPKSDFVKWEGANADEQKKGKAKLLEAYTEYFINQPSNKEVLYKVILDYIDYGNAFMMVDWRDDTVSHFKTSVGYIGPQFVRISPYDIRFNPIAPSFEQSPKIIRSIYTLGELKKKVEAQSFGDDIEQTRKAYDYMRNVRLNIAQQTAEFNERNAMYAVDGFTSYVAYLKSDYCEVLDFYGDYYDVHSDKFYQNAVISVIDRHKIIGIKENPSGISYNKVHHIGWRPRQDNVWAMGPLENLVGMQYRIDHLENLKADIFDLIAAPPLAIKGLVEDFEWAPFSRVYLGDDGQVDVLAPHVNALQANMDIENLERKMEEYAGSPKEAAGFRTPGEKTAYEVQRLENAANRIFYSKTKQFEELFLERAINEALELARRKMTTQLQIRSTNPTTNAVSFLDVTLEDLSGLGRMKPVAARNFADKAEKVQNVNAFFQSALGNDPEMKAHFSTIGLAKMFEELLDIEPYGVVRPYVRISEQQEAQQLINTAQEQNAAVAAAPAGITPDDTGTNKGPDVPGVGVQSLAQ
jgi:hypothetical protein